MPTKIGVNQHDLLHQHYPNDCCLCRLEKERTELLKHLCDKVDGMKKEYIPLENMEGRHNMDGFNQALDEVKQMLKGEMS